MSRTLARLLAGVVSTVSRLERPKRALRTNLLVRDYLSQKHEISTDKGVLSFVCTAPDELHYVDEFATREPETLAWIASFQRPCTFWDVGASTGIYSLYAALFPQTTVYAFEPYASNYAALSANVALNRMGGRISCLCVALSDYTGTAHLGSHRPGGGTAMHALGSPPEEGESVLVLTIDALRNMFQVAVPNYVKVDVDSIEEQIVSGAAETLADPRVRSLLIELDQTDAKTQRVIDFLASFGFVAHRAEQGDRVNVIFSRPATGASGGLH